MSKIKYFRNFILCGDLNYRCLVCKENCINTDRVDSHLRWEKHRKALKAQHCMTQFSKDSIFKLEPYYYCSYCNQTMQDIAEIKQHIDSDIHKNNKTHPVGATTRVEVKMVDDEVFIKNTRITNLQWHSIIDQQCALCKVNVQNILSSHFTTHEHMVRLIQARVNYVDDKYYRKIDKYTFQCFTCEKTFPINMFDDHFMNHASTKPSDPVTHPPIPKAPETLNRNAPMKDPPEIRIDKDGEEVKDCTMADTKGQHPTVVCETGMDKIRKTEWDFKLVADLNDEYFIINTETKKITCKICKTQTDVKLSAYDISNHLYAHGQYNSNTCSVYKAIIKYIDQNYVQRDIDHGAARSRAAKYGRDNFIKMNAGGSKAYCMLCDKFLSPSIDVFQGHTNGKFHKGHLELKGLIKPKKHERVVYKSISTMELIETLSHSADQKAFLINGNILIDEDSFLLIKRIEHGKYYIKTKCFACDETILPEEEKDHCISWKHKSKVLAAKSIADNRLYIREIRPRLYHCGICNETLPYWDTVKKHNPLIVHIQNLNTVLPEFIKKFGFSRPIVLKTNNDNLYMQLLNAVFNTKYVVKF